MARASATIGDIPYAVTLTAGKHALQADEPPALGGADAGPAPYELLLMSLGACTAITLRMYAERKQWAFESLRVELHYQKGDGRSRIDRVVTIVGALDADQRKRLGEIADKTPVTLTLRHGSDIFTEFR